MTSKTPRKTLFLAAALVLPLAACDGGLDLDGELTEAEAAALGEALFATTWENTETQPPAGADPAAGVPFSAEWTVETTAPCPVGGTLDLDGSASLSGDTETNVVNLTYQMTQVHNDCEVRAGEANQLFKLNGSPNVTTGYTVVTNNQSTTSGFEIAGAITGAIQWETEGRAGICSIAVEFDGGGNQTEGTANFSLEGTICGVTVTHQASIG